jgi:hypothetical protein
MSTTSTPKRAARDERIAQHVAARAVVAAHDDRALMPRSRMSARDSRARRASPLRRQVLADDAANVVLPEDSGETAIDFLQ